MTDRRLAIVSAGLRVPSSTRMLSDRLGAASTRALHEVGLEVAATTIELRDLAHDLTDHLLGDAPSPALKDALDATTGADGVVAVSPIFSASYNGLFKTFFDVIEGGALTGKPVLIGATAGTARHSLALEHAIRPLFTYLRALVVPIAVFAASEDWQRDGGVDEALAGRIDRAAAQFAELVAAHPHPGPSPHRQVTPGEQPLNP